MSLQQLYTYHETIYFLLFINNFPGICNYLYIRKKCYKFGLNNKFTNGAPYLTAPICHNITSYTQSELPAKHFQGIT